MTLSDVFVKVHANLVIYVFMQIIAFCNNGSTINADNNSETMMTIIETFNMKSFNKYVSCNLLFFMLSSIRLALKINIKTFMLHLIVLWHIFCQHKKQTTFLPLNVLQCGSWQCIFHENSWNCFVFAFQFYELCS